MAYGWDYTCEGWDAEKWYDLAHKVYSVCERIECEPGKPRPKVEKVGSYGNVKAVVVINIESIVDKRGFINACEWIYEEVMNSVSDTYIGRELDL